jgi:hypothetical protein
MRRIARIAVRDRSDEQGRHIDVLPGASAPRKRLKPPGTGGWYFSVAGDKGIILILLNRAWTVLKSPITAFLMVLSLSAQTQAVWYAFTSLGALTIFAELGFTLIVTQFVSHEFAALAYERGTIRGTPKELDSFFSLVRFSLRMYYAIIPVAIAILSVVGIIFFRAEDSATKMAWVVFAVSSGLGLFVALMQSIYQGLDKVAEVQANALIGSVVLPILNWAMLLLKFGIWALVVGSLVGYALTLFLLINADRSFWRQVFGHSIGRIRKWGRTILNLQWKYAISWAAGFFMFYLYVPVIYTSIGKVQAGQFGLTNSLVTTLSSFSIAWVTTRIPKLNVYAAQRDEQSLMFLFRRSLIASAVVQALGSLLLIGAFLILEHFRLFNGRLLSVRQAGLLIANVFITNLIGGIAFYARAHKEEPFYLVSSAAAVMITLALYTVLPRIGIDGFLLVNMAINGAFTLPLTLLIHRARKRHYVEALT